MKNVRYLIESAFNVLEEKEPICIKIKYDGKQFGVEIPIDAERSVIGSVCHTINENDLERTIGSCLLRFVMDKTMEKKNATTD